MRLLTEEETSTLEKEAQECARSISKAEIDIASNTADFKSLEEEIKSLNERIENISTQMRELNNNNKNLKQTISTQTQRAREIHAQMAEDDRNKKISELISSQPDFYKAISDRTSHAIEIAQPSMAGIVEFIPPELAYNRLQRKMEDNTLYTDEVIRLRAYKTQYDTMIKAICERKVDGERIKLTETNSAQDYIDAIIYEDTLQAMWQR